MQGRAEEAAWGPAGPLLLQDTQSAQWHRFLSFEGDSAKMARESIPDFTPLHKIN